MLARPDVPAILLATLLCLGATTGRAAAQADPAAVAIPAAPETQPALAGSAAHHHALSLVGEPKYGPDFKHFDWVNPDAPKGGTVRGFVEGSFDSLNPFTVKGVPAVEPRPHLRFADDEQPRRALGSSMGSSPSGSPIPSDYSIGDLQPQPEGALPRRHADHARGRHLLASRVRRRQSAHGASTTRTSSRRRRPASTRSPSPSTSRAIASCRRSSGSSAWCRRTIGKAKSANGEQRDITKTTMEVPIGSGAYKVKEFDAGRSHHLRARQGLLGEGSAGLQGAVELRRDQARPTSSTARLPSRSSSRASSTTGRKTSPASGRRPTVSPPSKRAGSRRRRSRSSASRRCKRSSSTCAASSSRTRACARPSPSPSTSRKPTRSCSMISTCASRATSTIPSSPRPVCRRAASSRS